MLRFWEVPLNLTSGLCWLVQTSSSTFRLHLMICDLLALTLSARMRRSRLTDTELQPLLAPNIAHDLAPLSGPSRRPIRKACSANGMTAPTRLSGSADVSSLHACCVRLQLSWWQNKKKKIYGLLPQTQQALKKQRQRDPDEVQRLVKTVGNRIWDGFSQSVGAVYRLLDAVA